MKVMTTSMHYHGFVKQGKIGFFHLLVKHLCLLQSVTGLSLSTISATKPTGKRVV